MSLGLLIPCNSGIFIHMYTTCSEVLEKPVSGPCVWQKGCCEPYAFLNLVVLCQIKFIESPQTQMKWLLSAPTELVRISRPSPTVRFDFTYHMQGLSFSKYDWYIAGILSDPDPVGHQQIPAKTTNKTQTAREDSHMWPKVLSFWFSLLYFPRFWAPSGFGSWSNFWIVTRRARRPISPDLCVI